MSNNKYRESIKTFFWGTFWIIGASVFWYHIAGNPVDELKLILNAKTTSGFIINSWEDAEGGDDGRTHWSYYISYNYKLPNGSAYTNSIHGNRQLKEEFRDITQPYPIEVEYLAHNPKISRIKGFGNATVFEWLWRKIGFSGLFLVMLVSPGFIIIIKTIKENKSP